MRSSYFRTLLFSLLALLVLNCAQAAEPLNPNYPDAPAVIDQQAFVKPAHLSLAATFVGTTELTGQNDGPEIERFLGAVNLKAGTPYCAAFVSYILDSTQVTQPTVRSALATNFITDQSISAKHVLRTGDAPYGSVIVWRRGSTIFGHTGFLEDQTAPNEFVTIEANTSPGERGSQRDGDGVWRRQRSIQPGNYFRITHFTPVSYGRFG